MASRPNRRVSSRLSASPSRRDLLRGLTAVLGTALAAPVAEAVLAAPTAAQLQRQALDPPSLGSDRLRLVGVLAERILPRTETPGALDAGVDRYIDVVVSGFLADDLRDAYLEGLEAVDRLAKERFGKALPDATVAQQDDMVAELDRMGYAASRDESSGLGRFYRLHKSLTIAGFFTSEVGQTEVLRTWRYGEFEADIEILPGERAWA